MNWLFEMQAEEKGSGVGQSGNAKSCLQPYLSFGSTILHPCGKRTAAVTVQEVLLWDIRGNTRQAVPGVVYWWTGLFDNPVSCAGS